MANKRVGASRYHFLAWIDFDRRRSIGILSEHEKDSEAAQCDHSVACERHISGHGRRSKAMTECRDNDERDKSNRYQRHDDLLRLLLLCKRTASHTPLQKLRVMFSEIE